MMKNILISMGALVLSVSVIAGGDDRDRGPIESLDLIAPAPISVPTPVSLTPTPVSLTPASDVAPTTEKFVGNQEPETMKLTVGGKTVSVHAHIACQDELGLSENNIAIFRKAQSGDYLYNTGPVEAFGTIFSPKRWNTYLGCVDVYGG